MGFFSFVSKNQGVQLVKAKKLDIKYKTDLSDNFYQAFYEAISDEC